MSGAERPIKLRFAPLRSAPLRSRKWYCGGRSTYLPALIGV